MNIGTFDEYLCVAADASCLVICCSSIRVAESATIYTVQEGIAIHSYLGVIFYGTSIATTQCTEDGEVRNALRVIEDIHVFIRVVICTLALTRALALTLTRALALTLTLAPVRAGELLGVIIHFSVVFTIFTLHVDGNIGASYAGVLTISAAEHREMRVLVVIIRFLPFLSFQQGIRGHTLLYIYRSCSSYGAGEVSAAIDVMRVEELVFSFVWIFIFVFTIEQCLFIIPADEFRSIP